MQGAQHTMQQTEHKSFQTPDETREFPNGRAEILQIGGGDGGRLVLAPGWRWSNDGKPPAGGRSCEGPPFHDPGRGPPPVLIGDGTELIAGAGGRTVPPGGRG